MKTHLIIVDKINEFGFLESFNDILILNDKNIIDIFLLSPFLYPRVNIETFSKDYSYIKVFSKRSNNIRTVCNYNRKKPVDEEYVYLLDDQIIYIILQKDLEKIERG